MVDEGNKIRKLGRGERENEVKRQKTKKSGDESKGRDMSER